MVSDYLPDNCHRCRPPRIRRRRWAFVEHRVDIGRDIHHTVHHLASPEFVPTVTKVDEEDVQW